MYHKKKPKWQQKEYIPRWLNDVMHEMKVDTYTAKEIEREKTIREMIEIGFIDPMTDEEIKKMAEMDKNKYEM